MHQLKGRSKKFSAISEESLQEKKNIFENKFLGFWGKSMLRNWGTCGALCDLVPFEQFKKRENIHGGVLPLVNLQAQAFLTMYKCYQIAQSITFVSKVSKFYFWAHA